VVQVDFHREGFGEHLAAVLKPRMARAERGDFAQGAANGGIEGEWEEVVSNGMTARVGVTSDSGGGGDWLVIARGQAAGQAAGGC
jgi:hypothetical protein